MGSQGRKRRWLWVFAFLLLPVLAVVLLISNWQTAGYIFLFVCLVAGFLRLCYLMCQLVTGKVGAIRWSPTPRYRRRQARRAAAGREAMASGRDPALAEWWRRLLGYLIDSAVLVVIFTILWAAINPSSPGGVFLLGSIQVVITFAYYALQHGMWGQTIGKRALGTTVVTSDTRSKISPPIAAGRAAVYAFAPIVPIVGIVFWLLNVLWLTWDTQKMALHDKAAETVVVKVSALPETL